MSRWRSVWLVARREILERGRSRGFLLGVLLTTALVVGSIVVSSMLFQDDAPVRVGLVEPTPATLAPTLEATADQLGRPIELTSYPDLAAGESALASDQVAALLHVPADLSGPGELRFRERADPAVSQLVAAAVVAVRVGAVLEQAGVDQATLAGAQATPTVGTLEEASEEDDAGTGLATIGAILVLVGIFGFGYTVLTGVVEEKQSRVVEVVLATVRARDLLMGKVLGIGILGLLQLAAFAIAGLIAIAVTQGGLTLPTATPSMLVVVSIFFVLGYALYATILGCLGALASRMEEASNASMPVTIVAMVSYFLCLFFVNQDPEGIVAQVLTYLPPSAPFAVPMRAALDAIGPLEIGLAIVVTVAAIWVAFGFAARVYSGAVLRAGGLVSIREAWRGE
jgi:ABC-2 type transport system permease protein